MKAEEGRKAEIIINSLRHIVCLTHFIFVHTLAFHRDTVAVVICSKSFPTQERRRSQTVMSHVMSVPFPFLELKEDKISKIGRKRLGDWEAGNAAPHGMLAVDSERPVTVATNLLETSGLIGPHSFALVIILFVGLPQDLMPLRKGHAAILPSRQSSFRDKLLAVTL